ncbi:Gfo/Idh/MocA family protein [Paramicrobacterium agarici]|uniref:Gfo/Idh/MocA family protein n=1 Tax=Paramicrobacterium agarici TaxID=630514 RepID=UPI00116BABBC|nr:Gfo/Idh/MocA family oxidoreductase [Microbacterium agarici]TQO23553.1 putative dehydrogenase [Microbacterium agarici]
MGSRLNADRGGSASSPLRIGIVGVGNISAQYFAELPRHAGVQIVAVADVDQGRADAVATERGVRSLTVDALLADPGVDLVLNLTIPAAHAEIARRALEAGKHVYGEKPLALTPEQAQPVLQLARDRGRRVGCAPDTVLGTGVQSARRALDDGRVGSPVAASVHWSAPGHELWHPSPAFYYQPGGGPLFDMGPYYLTSLVTLFGPVTRVSGTVRRSNRQRTVATGALAGEPVPVDVDTHITALLEHASGVTATVTMSFEVWATRAPLFEVYGTEGTIAVPDPNHFSQTGEVWTPESRQWMPLDDAAGFRDGGRGIGIVDLAEAIDEGRPHRASGELAFHVLEVMDAILRAGAEHAVVDIASTVERPDAVALR